MLSLPASYHIQEQIHNGSLNIAQLATCHSLNEPLASSAPHFPGSGGFFFAGRAGFFGPLPGKGGPFFFAPPGTGGPDFFPGTGGPFFPGIGGRFLPGIGGPGFLAPPGSGGPAFLAGMGGLGLAPPPPSSGGFLGALPPPPGNEGGPLLAPAAGSGGDFFASGAGAGASVTDDSPPILDIACTASNPALAFRTFPDLQTWQAISQRHLWTPSCGGDWLCAYCAAAL